MDSNNLALDDVACRIQQAETVLTMWLNTLTTDDGATPDMVGEVMSLLDGLANSISNHI
ncbi:hypothetical protein [Hafnia paralvei]|uniref:hypothetical protein n=1 Tax=Hafnia paralvei TaxID=546367 RepID=UPI0039AF7A89